MKLLLYCVAFFLIILLVSEMFLYIMDDEDEEIRFQSIKKMEKVNATCQRC